MPSLFDPQVRTGILDRVARLTPERTPVWGRFTAPEMVCHVSAALQGLGELDAGARGPGAAWPASRVFGRISGSSWGVLEYKHLDHHLRQFGV